MLRHLLVSLFYHFNEVDSFINNVFIVYPQNYLTIARYPCADYTITVYFLSSLLPVKVKRKH